MTTTTESTTQRATAAPAITTADTSASSSPPAHPNKIPVKHMKQDETCPKNPAIDGSDEDGPAPDHIKARDEAAGEGAEPSSAKTTTQASGGGGGVDHDNTSSDTHSQSACHSGDSSQHHDTDTNIAGPNAPATATPTSTPVVTGEGSGATASSKTVAVSTNPKPTTASKLTTQTPLVSTTTPAVPTATPTAQPATTTTTATTNGGGGSKPASKKRKPNPVLLADSQVVQTTQDVIALLQLYGPLTKPQLEYNLPQPSCRSLQDILELLVAIGIVHIVASEVMETDGTTGADSTNSGTNTMANSQTSTTALPSVSSEPLYGIFTTMNRHDVILPHQVLPALESAHAEYVASLKRANILHQYLQDTQAPPPPTTTTTVTPAANTAVTTNTTATNNNNSNNSYPTPRKLLQRILKDFPDIVNDPVYVAALRNVGITDISFHGTKSIKK